MERMAERRKKSSQNGPQLRLKIANAATYVGRMTKAANEAQKLDLSRTAQRPGFGLWVFTHGASDRRLSPRLTGFSVLPPRREDECIGC